MFLTSRMRWDYYQNCHFFSLFFDLEDFAHGTYNKSNFYSIITAYISIKLYYRAIIYGTRLY